MSEPPKAHITIIKGSHAVVMAHNAAHSSNIYPEILQAVGPDVLVGSAFYSLLSTHSGGSGFLKS